MVEKQIQDRHERFKSAEPLFIYRMMVLLEKHFYAIFFIPVKIHVITAAGAGQIGVRPEVLRDGDQSFVRIFGKCGKLARPRKGGW